MNRSFIKRVHIYKALTILVVLYIGLIVIASEKQSKAYNDYGAAFNPTRAELDLYPLGDSFEISHENWSKNFPSQPFKRWYKVLTDSEMGNSTTYEFPSKVDRPYHQRKTVILGTQLFYWKNYYAGEIDLFVNPIEDGREVRLQIVYYSENMNPSNHFEFDLDTVNLYSSTLEFDAPCTLDTEYSGPRDGEIDIGNAFKILQEWGLLTYETENDQQKLL